ELWKPGIDISERSVSRSMPKRRKPPSQNWKIFLDNHIGEHVSIGFFTVPTATFRVLFVLIILAHDRRKIVHSNVTEHPTSAWTARQLLQAFYDRKPARYLIRDRDGIYASPGLCVNRSTISLLPGSIHALVPSEPPWEKTPSVDTLHP
ncbi:MAG: Integrase, catalytic region, partial [Acidobacteria bacterium]|nr:Integrase, catalytic region [Acidobacteriota bacterium]